MKPFLPSVLALVASAAAADLDAKHDAPADAGALRGLKRSPPQRPVPGRQVALPAFDKKAEGEELVKLQQLGPTNAAISKVTLRLDAALYQGPLYSAMIRVYNQQIPGPTIRVKPGQQLHVTLINDLDGPTGNEVNNEFQLPNATNIHTHGPHVTAEDPGDNIFLKVKEKPFDAEDYEEVKGRKVGPRQFHNYRYFFDDNHMPGTFWMHPHLHGSSAVQTATASCFLIMEDPEDFPLRSMEEIEMALYNLQVGTETGGLREWATEAKDELSTWTEGNGFALNEGDTREPTAFDSVFLPNFQYKPKVTMKAGKWYRFRMLMATMQNGLNMGLNNGNCETKLISKDGIFIKEGGVYAPRDVTEIILFAGNRADIAIKCTASDEMIQLRSGSSNLDSNAGDVGTDVVFSLVVEGEDEAEEFPEYSDSVKTPCYLADLQNKDPDEITPIFYSGGTTIRDGAAAAFEYVDDKTPLPWQPTLQLGTIQQVNLGAAGFHPHHQHVNPFQLFDLESIAGYDEVSDASQVWFKNGDWHDLFQWVVGRADPSNNSSPLTAATVKAAINQFGGRMPFHCHRLNHEDRGMIAFYNVEGTEGTTWEGAETATPGCLPPARLPNKV